MQATEKCLVSGVISCIHHNRMFDVSVCVSKIQFTSAGCSACFAVDSSMCSLTFLHVDFGREACVT